MQLKRTLGVLLAVIVLLSVASCTSVGPEDVRQTAEEMRAAALSSIEQGLYYYKETQYASYDEEGTLVTPSQFLEVNLWADSDIDGNVLYDTVEGQKVLRDFKIKVYKRLNNRSDFQFISGLSKDNLDTTFFWQWDEDDNAALTRYAATREQLIASPVFANYSIEKKLANLADIMPEDINADASNLKIKRSGQLTAFTFSFTSEYLEKVANEQSIFSNAVRVHVEWAYGRIQNITVYQAGNGMIMKEDESYNIKITYQGPNFDIPAFDNDDWKNIGPTSDLPEVV